MNKKDRPQTPKPGMKLPNDPPVVTALLDEGDRMNLLGVHYNKVNPIAADACWRCGWSYHVAAAWLRCYLKGELIKKP